MAGVAPTSLEAYGGVDLARTQKAVYVAIESYWNARVGRVGPSDQQIADALGWPVNRVTGRRGELVEQGLVARGGVKRNVFGRRVYWWRPIEKWEQLILFGETPGERRRS